MLDGCTIDDKMWYHALMTMACLESEVRLDLQNQCLEEWVLYQLIRRGVIVTNSRVAHQDSHHMC